MPRASGSGAAGNAASAEALVKRGDEGYDAGNWREVIKSYAAALKAAPEHEQRGLLWLRIGMAHNALSHAKSAVEAYNKCIECGEPESCGTALYNRSVAHFNAGNYADALTDCSAGIQIDTRCWELLAHRGECHLKVQNYADAIDDITRAIANCKARDACHHSASPEEIEEMKANLKLAKAELKKAGKPAAGAKRGRAAAGLDASANASANGSPKGNGKANGNGNAAGDDDVVEVTGAAPSRNKRARQGKGKHSVASAPGAAEEHPPISAAAVEELKAQAGRSGNANAVSAAKAVSAWAMGSRYSPLYHGPDSYHNPNGAPPAPAPAPAAAAAPPASGVAPPPALSVPPSPASAASSPASVAAAAAANAANGRPQKPMRQWSEAEVGFWLTSIGKPFAAYVEAFADNCLNGAAVLELTPQLLAKLGVSELHAARIFGDVKTAALAEALAGASAGLNGSGNSVSRTSSNASGSGSVSGSGNGVTPTGDAAGDGSVNALFESVLDEQKKATAKAARLAAEKEALSDQQKCVICLTGARAIRFNPCGHLCCCMDCGRDGGPIKACPLCQHAIGERQRSFL